jgi:16S rRNA (guanine527-N7)-methyltransferase
MIDLSLLNEGAAKLGIKLDQTALNSLDQYASLLVEWNEKINLTSIVEPNQIVTKHFLDCLAVLAKLSIPQNASLIDVGTGAGFPGIVLKIARPDIKLTLLDSLNKRVMFLNEVISSLGLRETVAIHSRAEDAGNNPKLREHFDFSTARAVAPLSELAEYCIPFIKMSGIFLAMKGPEPNVEIDNAKNAIGTLGGQLHKQIVYEIPFTDITHSFILIKKISQTSTKYPRNPSRISKNPL